MIAIIGSQGFIGKRLVEFLKERQIEVFEFSSKLGNLVNPNNELLDNFQLPSNCSTVIFLSQSPHYKNFPDKYEDLIKINSILPFSVCKRAVQSNISRFIYFSTGSVYMPSLAPLSEKSLINRGSSYALSKLSGEDNLSLFGSKIEICNVRPFNMFGPSQTNMLIPNLTLSILKGLPVTLDGLKDEEAPGGLRISLMYIEDVIRALNALIEAPRLPGVLNLSSPVSMSVKEISKIIAKATSREIKFNYKDSVRDGDLISDVKLLSSYYRCQYLDFQKYISLFASKAALEYEK